MTRTVSISLALGGYDLNTGIVDGTVSAKGISIVPIIYGSPERHWRMLRFGDFDACEMSMASYIAARGAGDDRFVAIPVFPHRRFRHSYVFTASVSAIVEPKDLHGRKVGVRTWQATAGVWMRGILADEYGVDLKSIHWTAQDSEDVPLGPKSSYSFEVLTSGARVQDLLLQGDLDALIYPDIPDSISADDARVGRLFEDWRGTEIAYFKKTSIFPIMHCVVIKRDILERFPWVALNLYDAFVESKKLAYARLENPRNTSLAWVAKYLDDDRRVLGSDPWEFGLSTNNRNNLRHLIRYCHEQEIIPRMMTPDDLFFDSTIEPDIPRY